MWASFVWYLFDDLNVWKKIVAQEGGKYLTSPCFCSSESSGFTCSAFWYSPCCSQPMSNTYFPGPSGYKIKTEDNKGERHRLILIYNDTDHNDIRTDCCFCWLTLKSPIYVILEQWGKKQNKTIHKARMEPHNVTFFVVKNRKMSFLFFLKKSFYNTLTFWLCDEWSDSEGSIEDAPILKPLLISK